MQLVYCVHSSIYHLTSNQVVVFCFFLLELAAALPSAIQSDWATMRQTKNVTKGPFRVFLLIYFVFIYF